MEDKIIQCIVKATKRDELKTLGPDDSFESHDIDSLDRMSIMVEVEGLFDVDLDDVEPGTVGSVNEYVKLVSGKLKS